MPHSFDYQTVAKQVLATEIHALQQLEQYINEDFARACAMILANQTGKVVVMGMANQATLVRKLPPP